MSTVRALLRVLAAIGDHVMAPPRAPGRWEFASASYDTDHQP